MARPLDGDARRGEILDRAFVVFAAHGYHALSVRDLARHLDATTGTLYHWFDGKQSLFEAMLERQVARQVASALTQLADLAPEDRLDGLARFIRDNADDLQRTLVVALDFHREQGGGNGLAAALQAYQTAMVEGIGLDPASTRVVISLSLGELLQRILDPSRTIDLSGVTSLRMA